MLDDRQRHREQDALLDAHDDDGRRGDGRHHELARSQARHDRHALGVDSLAPMRNTTAASDRVGQVRKQVGQEQQHDHDDATGRELRDLAPAAGTVDHLGLGRAAIDHERARDAGRGVGHAQADEVHVLVESVAVAHGVRTRGGCALGQDDDDHRDDRGQQQPGVDREHLRRQRQATAGRRARCRGRSRRVPRGRTRSSRRSTRRRR